MGPLIIILSMVFVVVSVAMILVILVQRPQGGGLSAAFGGGAGSQSAFGAKTGDVLTIVTVGTFIAFLLIAIGLVLAVEARFSEPERVLAPLAPENVAAELAAADRVALTWDDLPDEERYVIERSPTPGGQWIEVGQVEADVTTFDDIAAPPDTEFLYRVVGVNAGGAGDMSEEVAIRTGPAPVEESEAGAETETEPGAAETTDESPTPAPAESETGEGEGDGEATEPTPASGQGEPGAADQPANEEPQAAGGGS